MNAEQRRAEAVRRLKRLQAMEDRDPEVEHRASLAFQAMQDGPTSRHPMVLNIWCNSRLGGTDLMYAFAQRDNCLAHDEPLYRGFMEEREISPPYEEALRASQPLFGFESVAETTFGPFPESTRLVVNKNLAKYLSQDFPTHSWLSAPHVRNLIVLQQPNDSVRSLLFDPKEFLSVDGASNVYVSANFTTKRLQPTVEEDDLSYTDQYCMVFDQKLEQRRPLIIIDHRQLLEHPRATLQALCRELDLEWDERMMSWPKGGMQQVDGVWASRYYGLLHAHSGFTPEYRETVTKFLAQNLPEDLQELADSGKDAVAFFEPHTMQMDSSGTFRQPPESESE